ncbi:acyl-CoA dehydrogenase [Natranaerofaba carboxydovora]|uniref:acyl-CoA dehydrogenase n=1 Tax=Natranaerofaba carboxydovora TaxID=2742683 RepID=UPI001F14195E|nr:acyl-CoA dehydrogenase [Natranaerofaba carboxydovora]
MRFELTEEEKMMQKMFKEFADQEIAPKAAEIDEKGEFPRENIEKLAENEMMGIVIPEEWGGSGASSLIYVMALEEISRACGTTGVILSVHTSVGTLPILYYGTEEQKNKYLTDLAQGKKLGAFALTEPNAGSDAAGIKTTAVKDGDNYILNGTKNFITNAGEADVYTVLASIDRSKGVKGITAFLVDKDTPGFSIGAEEKKMGLNGSKTCELAFSDAKVPAENMLGKESEGFKIAMSLLDGGRIGIAAQGLGIARAAYEAALEYSKTREQFGRSISKFQAISFKLADMATEIEAAKLLTYQAAKARDEKDPKGGKLASMAKQYATDTAMKVTTEAIQILGGYGYTREYPVERHFRDAKVTQIYEGTNQIQRLVISRDILEKG